MLLPPIFLQDNPYSIPCRVRVVAVFWTIDGDKGGKNRGCFQIECKGTKKFWNMQINERFF